jgi:hypothetical protein
MRLGALKIRQGGIIYPVDIFKHTAGFIVKIEKLLLIYLLS